MKKIAFLLLISAFIAGCAVSVADDAPKGVWIGKRDLDTTLACTINSLDEKYAATAASPSIPFIAGIKKINQIYEIRPAKTIAVGSDVIVVRLEKQEAQTKVILHTTAAFEKDTRAAIEACL